MSNGIASGTGVAAPAAGRAPARRREAMSDAARSRCGHDVATLDCCRDDALAAADVDTRLCAPHDASQPPRVDTMGRAISTGSAIATQGRRDLMKDFAGKIAVVTGGGTGMGRELARQLVAEGCNVAMCDVSAQAMAETKRLCEAERLPQGLRITTHRRRCLRRGAGAAVPERGRSAAGHRQDPSAVQQRRHRRRRQHDHRRPRGVGKDLQRLLGRRLPQHARLPADAAEGRRGAHRQHQQRQRLLGLGRAARAAHRLRGGEIRGEGLYRGADRRPPGERAAHQVLGRDAGPYRHRDRRQLAPDPERQRSPTR